MAARVSARLAPIFVAVLMALLPGVAQAQQYETDTGSLEKTDASLAPGDPVTVSGSGFDPSSRVVITIESDPQTLGSVEADAQGRISTTVRIPENLAAGTHTLKATGVTPDGATLVLSSQVTILGASGGLAATSRNVTWIVALAGVLVALAAAAVMVRSRA